MEKLTDLPNIGARSAQRLREAGIETPSDLKQLGSVEAVRRIRRTFRDRMPCISMLCALEGAIRGIRWHDIPKRERDELWQRYQTE